MDAVGLQDLIATRDTTPLWQRDPVHSRFTKDQGMTQILSDNVFVLSVAEVAPGGPRCSMLAK